MLRAFTSSSQFIQPLTPKHIFKHENFILLNITTKYLRKYCIFYKNINAEINAKDFNVNKKNKKKKLR